MAVHPAKFEFALLLVCSCAALAQLATLAIGWQQSMPETRYNTRLCASQGIPLGLLGVPTLMAAMVAAAPSSGKGYWAGWLRASLSVGLALTAWVYSCSSSSSSSSSGASCSSGGGGSHSSRNKGEASSNKSVMAAVGTLPLAPVAGSSRRTLCLCSSAAAATCQANGHGNGALHQGANGAANGCSNGGHAVTSALCRCGVAAAAAGPVTGARGRPQIVAFGTCTAIAVAAAVAAAACVLSITPSSVHASTSNVQPHSAPSLRLPSLPLPLPPLPPSRLPLALPTPLCLAPAAAVPIYHTLMTQLPHSFTLGEGLLVAHALTLLIAAAVFDLAQRALGPDPAAVFWVFPELARRDWPFPLAAWASIDLGGAPQEQNVQPSCLQREQQQLGSFVVMLCFWILLLGVCVWGVWHGRRGRAGAGAAAAADLNRQGQRQQQQRQQGQGSRPQAGAPAAVAAAAEAMGSSIPRALLLLLSLLGLTACCIALLDLALWTLLVFLPCSPRARLGALAYWGAVLAASLPLMYWALERTAAPAAEGGSRDGASVATAQTAPQVSGGKPGPSRAAVAGRGSNSGTFGVRQRHGRPGHGDAGSAANGDAAVARNAAGFPAATGRPRLRRPPRTPSRPLVPHILLRKGYHLLALLLFVPVLLSDAAMMQVSLAIAFALLVFAEVVRCTGAAMCASCGSGTLTTSPGTPGPTPAGATPKTPPASSVPSLSPLSHAALSLQAFMAGFVDERDAGPLFLTHVALLLGMAVPLWMAHACLTTTTALSPAPAAPASLPDLGHLSEPLGTSDATGAPVDVRSWPWLLVAASGMACLGLGDTAASAVGVLLGRLRPFTDSRKTAEGTAAGVAAMLLGWLGLWWWGAGQGQGGLWDSPASASGAVVTVVTVCAALLEACTHQLDNLVVPVYYAAGMLMCVGAFAASA